MHPLPARFAQLPTEEDTQIKSRRLLDIQGIEAVHEVWVWDGIKGESLIFIAADLPDTADEHLLHLARSAGFRAN